jgi:hypothetical protein
VRAAIPWHSAFSVTRKARNCFHRFVRIAGFNDNAAMIGFDESGNFAILGSNGDDWPASCGNSIDLAWNDPALGKLAPRGSIRVLLLKVLMRPNA